VENFESKRRELLTTLSLGRIAEMLAPVVPAGNLRSFEVLEGGHRNINLLLHLHADGPLVMRIYLREPSACRKEVHLLDCVAGHLPIPEVIYADYASEQPYGPYIIYRYIVGLTFQELKATGNLDNMAEAAYAVGKALARFQNISAPAGLPGPSPEELDVCLSSDILRARIGNSQRDRLEKYFSNWTFHPLYRERGLVHGDFNNRNTLFRRQDGEWTVAAILDWEDGFSGSPLWDAARFICYERRARPCREPHFSRGFRDAGGSLPENWEGFARAVNAIGIAKALSLPDTPELFIPELTSLIAAILDDRDLS
jgi:aminoglycoside phosphotransferase (APT) family kinase protein